MVKNSSFLTSYSTFAIPGVDSGTRLVVTETPERHQILISIVDENAHVHTTIRFNKEHWDALLEVRFQLNLESIAVATVNKLGGIPA